jgi:hypothetical protein
MRPFRFAIVEGMAAVVALALILAVSRYSPAAGALLLAVVVVGVISISVYHSPAACAWLNALSQRPVGRWGRWVLILVLSASPYVLFFDPVGLVPWRAHTTREPLANYLIFSDDVAYIAGSRTWSRTVANLLVPHNTHIVPAWRLVTWGLVQCAGNLETLPQVLAVASYSILVVVMLMTGRIVERETGRTAFGLAAMALVGTTSLMLVPATWYSAGQPLWAGAVILATLWYAQFYRKTGRKLALVLSAVSALFGGSFWTLGHLAGPTSAVYLWIDGRRRCRLAAIVLLGTSILAVVLSFALAARPIDARISFHGRTALEALNPPQGVLHTAQAIPENLIFANLGLTVQTTAFQGVIFTLGLLLLWTRRVWRQALRSRSLKDDSPTATRLDGFALSPLECAGAALALGSYLVEWSFRGYFEFKFLRTINLHFIVPWYDVIPQIGAVLMALGWWSSSNPEQASRLVRAKPVPTTWLGALGVVVLATGLIVLNRPRVESLVRSTVHPLLASERTLYYPTTRLQNMRAATLLTQQADWQRAHLRRLDKAQEIARRMGISRDALRAALGHPWVAGTVHQLRPELHDQYDAIGLLDVAEHGRAVDAVTVVQALLQYFMTEREPRPSWLMPNDPWPPPVDNSQSN